MMRAKNKLSVSLLCLWFPWISIFAASTPPKPPLILPFAVQKAGNIVTTELRVTQHRIYWFDLRLGFKENNAEDRKRVKKLAGDYGRDKNANLRDPGISIPLKLKINIIESSGESVFYEKEILEEEMFAYGADSFSKKIDRVELKPGHYRISVESLKDIPELIGTPVTLGIGWAPKTTPID